MILTMRHLIACFLVPLSLLAGMAGYAQNKTACELLTKPRAEVILGVPLEPLKPFAPYRSLLDPDFTSGTSDQGCQLSNFTFSYSTPHQVRPAKVINVPLEVRYSSTPDPGAVDKARKEVDVRTRDHPTDLPGLGDSAFWIGEPNNITLFVFVGGTKRLMIGPSNIGLEQEKALAATALLALGGKTGVAYGAQPTGLTKPVLGNPNPSTMDQLKRALTAKADTGDARAQFALGKLYASGVLASDGSALHDYAGAAYWYSQASNRGQTQASYELALLYRDGLGVPVNPAQSFTLLQKAAEGNYVPAMSPLADAYSDQRTPVSSQRATYWAMKAAEAGDSRGWLTLGFEWYAGKLGGDPPSTYHAAMDSWKKAAAAGNCMAMMEIGELYSKGDGVPADKSQGQSWAGKAQSCFNGDLQSMQQQAMQFRARAVSGRDPLLSAIPAVPSLTIGGRSASARPGVPGKNGSSVSDNTKFLAGVAAVIAVAIAVAALSPSTGNADTNDSGTNPINRLAQESNDKMWDCVGGGGTIGLGGSCMVRY
jgi:TPR repeat protein